MCESICFSRRQSPCSLSRCWSLKLTLYLVVFKTIFFLKRSWRCNLPPNKRRRQRNWPCNFRPNKTRAAAVGLSVSSHIGLHGGAYVRSVGRKWRHNQTKNFWHWCVYQNLLDMGLRARSSVINWRTIYSLDGDLSTGYKLSPLFEQPRLG